MCTENFIENKDVGMGLSMISCLGIGIFLFPSLSWCDILTSSSFQRNDFSTCSTYFWIWGRAPIKMECRYTVTSVCTLVVVALASSADKATIVWYLKANSTSTSIQCTIGSAQRQGRN